MKMTAKQLAAAGRGGDTRLAHLTPGEVVIPRSAAAQALGLLSEAGFNPDRYQVGRSKNSRNPRTGLLEFYEDAGDDGSGRGGERSDGHGNTSDGRGNRTGDGGGYGGDMGGADQREASRRERAGLGEGGWDANGSRDDGRYGRSDGSFGEKDRAASFGAFGVTDWGSGVLRARTPAELARYGISQQDLSGLRTAGWGVIAPGASMPSMQRKMSLVGQFSPLPGGSQLGAFAGTAIDRATLRNSLQELGYDARYSDAMAAGRTAPGLASSMASPVVNELFGVYGGLVNKLAGSRLASKAGDMAFDQTMAGVPGSRPAATQADGRQGGIAGLLDADSYQSAPTTAVAANAGYSYAPGVVTRAAWNPVQWGTQYDPLMRG